MKPFAWELFWEILILMSANVIYVLLFLKCLSLNNLWAKYKLAIFLLMILPNTILSCICLDLVTASKGFSVPPAIRLRLQVFSAGFLITFAFLIFLIQKIGHAHEKRRKPEQATYLEEVNPTPLPRTEQPIKNVQVWKHDYKNHLITLTKMAKERQYSDLLKYLEEWQTSLPEYFNDISTGNAAIDAIVSSKLILARQEGIQFDHFIMLPSACPLSNLKLTTILGNLLDNAIEACEKMIEQEEERSPWIRLVIKTFRDMFQIQITNSSDGNYDITPDNQFLTTKNETSLHGIGLQHVNDIVHSIHGILEIQPGQEQFKITVLVPLSLSKGGLTNELCNCRR